MAAPADPQDAMSGAAPAGPLLELGSAPADLHAAPNIIHRLLTLPLGSPIPMCLELYTGSVLRCYECLEKDIDGHTNMSQNSRFSRVLRFLQTHGSCPGHIEEITAKLGTRLWIVNAEFNVPHQCGKCINAFARTCKAVHRWFYFHFDGKRYVKASWTWKKMVCKEGGENGWKKRKGSCDEQPLIRANCERASEQAITAPSDLRALYGDHCSERFASERSLLRASERLLRLEHFMSNGGTSLTSPTRNKIHDSKRKYPFG